jgi:GNAT superfamily N-acetyltransferase
MSQLKAVEIPRPARPQSFTIRQMASPEEVQLAIDWAAAEGWNPGLHDADSFFAADPDGFFVGRLGGLPIGCCFAVIYNDTYAFFGGYIVQPEYRGRGYGMQMTRARLAYVGHRNVGLDGVLAMQKKYAQLGFRTAHRNVRFQKEGAGEPRPGVVEVARVPFREVVAYDTVHFSAPRVGFLRRWIRPPGGAALGAVRDGRLAGYGVLRPCRQGFKIGPLFADDEQVADDLFLSLGARAEGQPVVLDVPEANPAAAALAERHGMRPVFEVARMYLKGRPDVPMEHVFGMTTFELG